MTERKRKYAEGRLACKNKKQAALDAGVPPRGAAVEGHRLEKDPEVKGYIEAEQRRLSAATGMTRERWLQGLIELAEVDMTCFARWGDGALVVVPSAQLPKGAGRLIREVQEMPTDNGPRIKVKLRDCIKAYELIGRALGYSEPAKDPAAGLTGIKITIEDYTADEG
jgi:phage terminase small subunit